MTQPPPSRIAAFKHTTPGTSGREWLRESPPVRKLSRGKRK